VGTHVAFATAPLPSAPEVDVQVELHDLQQVEIRCVYRMGDAEAVRFDTHVYLFIPRNVGLNADNYPKQDFYGDVTALMRLDAAPLPLEELADATKPRSPLSRLTAAVAELATDRTPPTAPLATYVRLYAHLQAEGARAELRRLRELARERPELLLDEIPPTMERIRRSLLAFRRVRAAFAPYELLCHRQLVEAIRLADEYMSLTLEERLANLGDALADDALTDGRGVVPRATALLAELARSEAEHRAKHDFLVLTGTDDPGFGEYYAYRSSLLKKAVQQALYLDVRKAQADTFVRNGVGAVGAALAAIWALATQLPQTMADLSLGTKLVVFVAAVLAYVAKDRIKFLTNEYVVPKLRRFDFVTRITSGTLRTIGLGMVETRLYEAMRFTKLSELPEEIRRVRTERRTIQAFEGPMLEEVIHYRKVLDVEQEDEKERLPEGYGLRDIMRFNVRHFLVRLDDPEEKVRYFDTGREAFGEAKIPKVYHLNLVIRVERDDAHGRRTQRLDHLRIVLNKQRIVRIERISSR
jgi:hypothetical protein